MQNVGGLVRYSLLLLAILIVLGCAVSSTESQGLPDPSRNFSDVTTDYLPVVMVVLPGGNGLCTGTFISEKAVLTAAHCTKKSGRYTVVTAFGNNEEKLNLSSYTVENLGEGVVNDPSDISLLIFDEAVASRSKGQIYDLGDSVNEGDQTRLVGYGCNNLNTRGGAGVKRTGINTIYRVSDYLEFLTPRSSTSSSRNILGPENRAASCFGDSGGPALKFSGNDFKLVGVTHAGGTTEMELVSEYVNVATHSANRRFISDMSSKYNLGIVGL